MSTSSEYEEEESPNHHFGTNQLSFNELINETKDRKELEKEIAALSSQVQYLRDAIAEHEKQENIIKTQNMVLFYFLFSFSDL